MRVYIIIIIIIFIYPYTRIIIILDYDTSKILLTETSMLWSKCHY